MKILIQFWPNRTIKTINSKEFPNTLSVKVRSQCHSSYINLTF